MRSPPDSRITDTPTDSRKPVNIIVFNDHPVFRSSLIWKLSEFPEIQITADIGSLSETLHTAKEMEHIVGAVVADMRIGDGNSEGVESVRVLSTDLKPVPVIVLSESYSSSHANKLKAVGAKEVTRKSTPIRQLVETILTAADSQKTPANADSQNGAAA